MIREYREREEEAERRKRVEKEETGKKRGGEIESGE